MTTSRTSSELRTSAGLLVRWEGDTLGRHEIDPRGWWIKAEGRLRPSLSRPHSNQESSARRSGRGREERVRSGANAGEPSREPLLPRGTGERAHAVAGVEELVARLEGEP
jgi:hypothetical protein